MSDIRERDRALRLALTLIAAAMLAGCGDSPSDDDGGTSTPRSDVPATLQGEWFVGTVQSYSQLYADGSWDTSLQVSTGRGFLLTADGDYVMGAVSENVVGSCTNTFLSYYEGTVVVDDTTITFHPVVAEGRARTCDGDEDRDVSDEPEVWSDWYVSEVDPFGNNVTNLTVTYATGAQQNFIFNRGVPMFD